MFHHKIKLRLVTKTIYLVLQNKSKNASTMMLFTLHIDRAQSSYKHSEHHQNGQQDDGG